MIATHSLQAPAADDWLAAPPATTSRTSNFANWLNKESHQLQQAGTRYRVQNDFSAAERRHCPVTSSSGPLRDVTKTRLHSAGSDDRNVRFDDVSTSCAPAAVSLQDHANAVCYNIKPADVACAGNNANSVQTNQR